MKQFHCTLVLFIGLVNSGYTKVHFSELGHACKRSDPKFLDCVKKTAAEDVLPKFIEGIRSLGIPPLDPLFVPFTEINQSDRPVGLKLNLTNAKHQGYKNLVFNEFRHSEDGDVKKTEFVGTVSKYSIDATCETGGKILILPISGLGPCHLSATGIDIEAKMETKDKVKKGVTYCEITKTEVNLKFKGGSFELHGLFNGNKQLEKTLNQFVNENALEVLNEMKPALEKVFSAIAYKIVSPMYKKIPCNELILP